MFAKKMFILILSFFLLANNCKAQKILALDNYRLLGFKRIRFKEGDMIKFQLKGDKVKYAGEILQLTDSTLEIKGMNISLKLIDVVYRDRGNFLTKSFSKVFIWSGLGFIILDTGNNLIMNDPAVDKRAVIAGGSLVLIGFTMEILCIKKYRIGNRNTLKVIDVSVIP